MNGISALIKELSYSSLAPSTMCQHRERLAVCNPNPFSEDEIGYSFSFSAKFVFCVY